MTVAPVAAVEAVSLLDRLSTLPNQIPKPSTTSFSQLLLNGIDGANAKQVQADNLVRAFAVDDSIPVHQVTFALAQAQLSLELMTQVRSRVLEGFQQLMNMQL